MPTRHISGSPRAFRLSGKKPVVSAFPSGGPGRSVLPIGPYVPGTSDNDSTPLGTRARP